MDLHTEQSATPAEPVSQPAPLPPASRGYVSLPPEPEPVRGSGPPWFVIFTLFIIGAAAIGGAYQSGKLSMFFNHPNPVALAKAPVAAPPLPAPALKPGVFVVTTISVGQPSIAIINGKTRGEGDPVEAPGVTGWRIKQIVDGAVWLQNGSTFASVPLATPTLKPLDDTLKPLN